MKVYVAGSSLYTSEAKILRDLVLLHGHEITHDWIPAVEEHGPNGPRLSRQQLTEFAEADKKGVIEADIIIVLAHRDICGAWVEMGIALAHNITVWIVEPKRENIFLYCEGVIVMDHSEVIEGIKVWSNNDVLDT